MTPSLLVVPSSDPAICRVTGTFSTLDTLPTSNVEILFTLVDVVPPNAIVKNTNLIARRFVKTLTSFGGRLEYEGNDYVDLIRNDFITPPNTKYRIQVPTTGLDKTVSLVTPTFDLISLAATAVGDAVGIVAAPSNPFDFSGLPGGVAPTVGMYMAPRDINTLWYICAGDVEWTVIDRTHL